MTVEKRAISLKNNNGYKWYLYEKTYAKGFLIINNKIYTDEKLAEFINQAADIDSVLETLKTAEGYYSVVINFEDCVFAAVDHIRSFPLFCVNNNGTVMLTDSIDAEVLKNSDFDKDVRNIWSASLFVPTNRTLIENAKQLCSGEYVVLKNNSADIKRYWKFSYKDEQITNIDEACNVLKTAYVNVFKKVIELLNGRTAVLPLSGGYDSRLVLHFLTELGYKNIITYTYGSRNLDDCDISKEVANVYGVPNYVIEYSGSQLSKMYKENYKDLFLFAANAASVPCVQEWYAITELKKRGIVNENCVLVPGYGGVLPGHYLRKELIDGTENMSEYFKNLVIKTFFSQTVGVDKDKVFGVLNGFDIFSNLTNKSSAHDYAEAYERFVFEDEQSKFVQNATRIYEFNNLQWITPFFFKEQFEVWGSIDNELRLNNKAFKKMCDELYSVRGVNIRFTGSKVSVNARKINPIIRKLCNIPKAICSREKLHYLNVLIPYGKFVKYSLIKRKATINPIVSSEYFSIVDEYIKANKG